MKYQQMLGRLCFEAGINVTKEMKLKSNVYLGQFCLCRVVELVVVTDKVLVWNLVVCLRLKFSLKDKNKKHDSTTKLNS